MLDVDALSTMIADIVSEEVGKAVTPLYAKIAELEARPVGSQMDEVKGVVEIMISDALVTKAVNQATVEKLIETEIAKLPEPKGVDSEELAAIVIEAVAALPPAQDGKSVEIDDVLPVIASEVAKAFEALPTPKDGESGKDGRGVKDLIIDRNGQLVATMDDGEMKTLGVVIGKNGDDGQPGRDGFNLDDFDCEVVDERTINLKFVRGDTCHSYELVFPVPVYQGVFKEGVTYSAGDICTWGGSAWSAKRETSDKPDMPDSGWQLAVKRGRDGKDFKPKDAA